jgi:hypothetical protein
MTGELKILNEALSSGIHEIIELIKRDCKPFLKHKQILFRGMEETKEIGINKVSRNRRPLNSSKEFARFYDKYSKENRLPLRSQSIFTVANPDTTVEYGDSFMIFPRGNFDYYWMKEIPDMWIGDLNVAFFNEEIQKIYDMLASTDKVDVILDRLISYIKNETDYDHSSALPEGLVHIFEELKAKNYVTNRFTSGNDTTHEIIIDCKDYYFIRETRENAKIVMQELGLRVL